MENAETRLPLDEAFTEAIEDYAQRAAIIVSADMVLCTALASYAVMDGMEHPVKQATANAERIACQSATANTGTEMYEQLKDLVRGQMNEPWVVKKQQQLIARLNDSCDCLMCRLASKLEIQLDMHDQP